MKQVSERLLANSLLSCFFHISFLLDHGPGSVTGPSRSSSPNNTICCVPNSKPAECPNECNSNLCARLNVPPGTPCSTKCFPYICNCKDGFYSNSCAQCVTKEQCNDTDTCAAPPTICPGMNEELINCYDPRKARVCNPRDPAFDQSCRREDSPFPLDLLSLFGWNDKTGQSCILQICDCKKGYLRNKCGICVEAAHCSKECKLTNADSCSDPEEIRYDEWRPCDARTCKNLKTPTNCVKEWSKVYRNRCDCKDGYYRDDCGRCVPEGQCANQAPCKCTDPCLLIPNSQIEELNSCTARTCYTAKLKGARCKTAIFVDCNCKEGFVYNKDIECIKLEECTQADIEAAKNFTKEEDFITLGTLSA